jgi:hypothetical protein
MQPIASRAAVYILRVSHPRFGFVARLSGLAAANLVTR